MDTVASYLLHLLDATFPSQSCFYGFHKDLASTSFMKTEKVSIRYGRKQILRVFLMFLLAFAASESLLSRQLREMQDQLC
ncbi:hypothetical protein Tco_0652169 [Tanacetum coccineum]|uniref:Uncharacterized protein n=1 Tax=Tanacetum coccineum TaxID=301880 RepID=A0ABQ4WXG2_9ASTR